MKILYVVVLICVLSSTLAIGNDATSFQETINQKSSSSALDDSKLIKVAGLSPFSTYVHQLTISSGIFNELYDVSFKDPSEIAAGFLYGAMYFSQYAGSAYAGSLPLEVSLAAKKAFLRGLTPLKYFIPFTNTAENYFTITGIMTPSNIQSLAFSYYLELDKSLKAIGTLDNPVSHLYALTSANANTIESFGGLSPENVAYLMRRYIDDWNRV